MTEIHHTGIRYESPTQDRLDARVAAADKPGQHIWVILATWRVIDPRAWRDHATGPQSLDGENLIAVAGPGCFKCEQPYSNRLARQVCRGSTSASPS